MNIVFYFLILVGIAAVFVLVASVFPAVGRLVFRIKDNVENNINYEENNEKGKW